MERMKELIRILSLANKEYYQNANEIMTNKEYDALYDELCRLEKESGVVYHNSPTQNIGYTVVSSLPKEEHPVPMQSLDKTKDVNDLEAFLGNRVGILSWKLDGLTVVCTYENGKLQKAVTRGNGLIGEVITENAKTFVNLPMEIPYKERLVVRGEAVIKYKDFEKINATLNGEEKYKNPRNLCSGSVRQLDSRVTGQRSVNFICFNLVSTNNKLKTIQERFKWLESIGFECVNYMAVTKETLQSAVESFSNMVKDNPVPVDGLVLTFDDYEYGLSLGSTSKFPRHSLAFKWQDETVSTVLREVEWNTSRTGLINPVAVFDPVELEGTTVSRATLNNVSFIESLQLGIGDEITVYKANMIIPTIDDNLTRSDTLQIPEKCPVCGAPTEIRQVNSSKMLYCTGDNCPAQTLKLFANFVKRDAMNIDGLSEATLDRLLSKGLLNKFEDIYTLHEHKKEILTLEGFGKTKVDKLLKAIEKSRDVTLERFIVALGIPNVGRTQSKLIAAHANDSWERFIQMLAVGHDFTCIQGIGEVIDRSIHVWYSYNMEQLNNLATQMRFHEKKEVGSNLQGMSFCITGSLHMYKNRNELKAYIESKGGRVVSSVTKTTTYLINNDSTSTSSKNKSAKALGVPIITEEELQTIN